MRLARWALVDSGVWHATGRIQNTECARTSVKPMRSFEKWQYVYLCVVGRSSYPFLFRGDGEAGRLIPWFVGGRRYLYPGIERDGYWSFFFALEYGGDLVAA